MIMKSYAADRASISSLIRKEFKSSEGFGGIGPAVTISSPAYGDFFTSPSNSEIPARNEERPLELSILNTLCTSGFLRSASIIIPF